MVLASHFCCPHMSRGKQNVSSTSCNDAQNLSPPHLAAAAAGTSVANDVCLSSPPNITGYNGACTRPLSSVHSSSVGQTSSQRLATSLPLLSGVASIPLFEQLCLLHQQRNDSVGGDVCPLDPEVIARQSVINNKVRELLKTNVRVRGKPLDAESPDFIDLQHLHKRQSQGAASSNKAQDHSCPADTPQRKVSAAESDYSETSSHHATSPAQTSECRTDEALATTPSCVTTSSFSVSIPPLQDGDPPWMVFLGYTPTQMLNREQSKKKNSKALQHKSAPRYSHDWISALERMNEELDFFGRLHEELCGLVLWLDPTPEELLLRQRVIAKVKIVAQALWPECSVLSFGSYYTGLWLPNGDMDISIMGVEGPQIFNLRMLTVCLTRLGIPLAVEVISSARVPIVKYIDSESGISVDLSLNTDSAVDTTEYVVAQLQAYPWLRPLILIMKLYLQQRNLGETYRGGVGSYLLFVLCLSFLQQHRSLSSPELRSSVGLGHLVFDFLQLYGRDFNYDTTAISVRAGGRYFPKTQNQWFNTEKPSLLAVESPLATELDLGRNSYDIRTVRNCFRQSFLTLAELLQAWQRDGVSKRASIVQHFIFKTDPLMTRRRRSPLIFSGSSSLEASDWWQSVKGYFNQPVAGIRPKPVLPLSLVEQVRRDLDAAGDSVATTVGVVRDGKKRVEKRNRTNDFTFDDDVGSSVRKVSSNAHISPFGYNPHLPHGGLESPDRTRSSHRRTYRLQKSNITAVASSRRDSSTNPSPQLRLVSAVPSTTIDTPFSRDGSSTSPIPASQVLNNSAPERLERLVRRPIVEQWD